MSPNGLHTQNYGPFGVETILNRQFWGYTGSTHATRGSPTKIGMTYSDWIQPRISKYGMYSHPLISNTLW